MSRRTRRRLLAALGLHGLTHLDPVVLGALADERPVLLIGPHGSAKSELVNRLAMALGLSHRHYNASLVSFDDLIGYPVPDTDGDTVRFLTTPASLWAAESVFIDEISRCRPETANKLFSVIHERRVQGLELERLRYRWAAMNPPGADDEECGDANGYTGSLPLDAALADRFAWIVELPAFDTLGMAARRRIVSGPGAADDPPPLARLVAEARHDLALLSGPDPWVVRWTLALVPLLKEAGLRLSGRRAAFLARSVHAVEAAAGVLGDPLGLPAAAWLALRHGLPHPACGAALDLEVLRTVHELACEEAGAAAASPWPAIRAEADPGRKLALAFAADPEVVDRERLSLLVSDTLAALPAGARAALSVLIARQPGVEERLDAATLELVAAPLARVARLTAEGVERGRIEARHKPEWRRLRRAVCRLARSADPDAPLLANLLQVLFVHQRALQGDGETPGRVVAHFRRWRTALEGGAARRAA